MNLKPFTAISLLFVMTFSLYIVGNQAFRLEIQNKYINHTDKEILDDLLDPEKYDRRMRPSLKTLVNVSVLLLTLSSPDESSVTYEIGFLMFQMWDDPRLQFEDGKHKYLNALMHAEMVWMPDTYFIKHGEFKYPLDRFDPIHIALRIFPNGTVLYTTRRNMILTCEGNLKIFPFDSPKCFFAIESISHEKDQLELKWDTRVAMKASDSMKTMNAYMMRNETNICNKKHTWRWQEYSCLSVLLVFSRDKSFYFSTVFVPGMVLVTSSFISFWLDVNAVPARVMISVTTMLNFCTTTNSFRSKLPVVSDLTAMNLWDFVCMFFIYASMIEFIIVNYLHRKIPHTSRPNSGDRQSFAAQSEYFRHQPNGKKPVDSTHFQTDHIPLNRNKEEFELKAPLVGGDDPSVVSQSNHRQRKTDRNRSLSDINQINTSVRAPISGSMSLHDHERMRAAASVFAWLRRPQLFKSTEMTSRARLARSIDHISKTVFTLLFCLFSFFYFLTYAVIKPAQLDEWIVKEFEPNEEDQYITTTETYSTEPTL